MDKQFFAELGEAAARIMIKSATGIAGPSSLFNVGGSAPKSTPTPTATPNPGMAKPAPSATPTAPPGVSKPGAIGPVAMHTTISPSYNTAVTTPSFGAASSTRTGRVGSNINTEYRTPTSADRAVQGIGKGYATRDPYNNRMLRGPNVLPVLQQQGANANAMSNQLQLNDPRQNALATLLKNIQARVPGEGKENGAGGAVK